MEKNKFRVVFDANVIIASHLSKSEDSPNKEIIKKWQDKEFNILWTEDILNEYIDKLKYFNIREELIVKFIDLSYLTLLFNI